MAELASLIPELEDVLQHDSADRRTAAIERITALFLVDAERYTAEHVELFDDVLSRLIVEIETKTLAELARRLAPIANAPLRVVRRLAHDDDITVAVGPACAFVDIVSIAIPCSASASRRRSARRLARLYASIPGIRVSSMISIRMRLGEPSRTSRRQTRSPCTAGRSRSSTTTS